MKSVLKKIVSIALSVSMMFSVLPSSFAEKNIIASVEAADHAEEIHIWDGTADVSWFDAKETELHISTPEQFAGLAELATEYKITKGKTFVIDNDLYMNDISNYDNWENEEPNNVFDIIKYFSGSIDGNGHVIYGLYTIDPLFYSLSNASISNIYFEDFFIPAGVIGMSTDRELCLAGIAAKSNESAFSNVYVCGKIVFNTYLYYNSKAPSYATILYMGGLIGKSSNSCFRNCICDIDILGKSSVNKKKYFRVYTGGICSSADKNTYIINCINSGPIGVITENSFVAGICPLGGLIYCCKNEGDILSLFHAYGIGGDTAINCYNVGRINSEDSYGIGNNKIENTYNVGKISATSNNYAIGPLATNSYYLTGTGGIDNERLTIAQNETNMKKESFAESLGDAFVYVEGEYPKLAFEVGKTASDFDKKSLSFSKIGETDKLELYTTYNGKPEWSSSDVSVATVDSDGVVTAVGNGTATIYATCSDSKASCTVTSTFGYYLSDTELSLKKGSVHDLAVLSSATKEPATGIEFKWSSSDDSVASVDSNGKITAKSEGSATITVKIGNTERSCIVSVYDNQIPSATTTVTTTTTSKETTTTTTTTSKTTTTSMVWYVTTQTSISVEGVFAEISNTAINDYNGGPKQVSLIERLVHTNDESAVIGFSNNVWDISDDVKLCNLRSKSNINGQPCYEVNLYYVGKALTDTLGNIVLAEGDLLRDENGNLLTFETNRILGDVDNNKHIDGSDASIILHDYSKTSIGSPSELNDIQKLASDVNKDGMVNAIDAEIILNYYAWLSFGGDSYITLDQYIINTYKDMVSTVYTEKGGYSEDEINNSTIKPHLYIETNPSYLAEGDFIGGDKIQCNVGIVDYNFDSSDFSFGLHIYYDSRLEIESDQARDGRCVYTDKSINMISADSGSSNNGMKELFVCACGNLQKSESPRNLFSFYLKLPANAKGGDVYPIDIRYEKGDLFMNGSINEEGSLAQAYIFTKGIYNENNPNPSINSNYSIAKSNDTFIEIKQTTITTSTTTTTTTTSSITTTTSKTTSSTTTTSTTTTTTSTTSLPPLKIDVTNITLIDGDQYTVTANRKDLTYKSNNSNVAVVSPKGVITAVGTGTATISVIDSESNVVQIKVTVKPITTNTTTTTTATTITTTTTTLPVKPYDYMLGDVNNDGLINAVDASSVLSYYAMISTNKDGGYNDNQKAAADVNDDGLINAVDASNILSYYAYVSTTKEEIKSLKEYIKK